MSATTLLVPATAPRVLTRVSWPDREPVARGADALAGCFPGVPVLDGLRQQVHRLVGLNEDRGVFGARPASRPTAAPGAPASATG
ncbi:hypothetical protein E1265_08110 [Streptomyces sp. 8K308]|uniref:hypothetical protein n=1 Tax=Streptomyces sp. 8K308 TaxID=2530388 RepID=UPI00104AB3AA|nr:hypothetical protein [Streptomyces sp. 8K308]TDC25034.1 hypothetical protein E1265_08110 [Streptomyces sp. 8K308]